MKNSAMMLLGVLLLVLAFGSAKAQDVAKTPYVSWSPDGTMLAVGGKGVQIVDPVSMKVMNALTTDGQTTEAAWNSNSTRLVTKSDAELKIWQSPGDPHLSHIALTIPTYRGIMRGMSWSPDNSQIATVYDEVVDLWDAKTSRNIRTLTGHWGNVDDLIWTSDNRLALAGGDSTVRIIDPTGKSLTNFYASNAIPVPAVTAIATSPDGNQMAIGLEDFPIEIWGNTRTGIANDLGELWEENPQTVLKGGVQGMDHPLSLSWNSTGQLIASGATDGTVRIWDAMTGTEIQSIEVGTDTPVNSVAWSPDGTKLAYGKPDGTVEIIPAPISIATPEATKNVP